MGMSWRVIERPFFFVLFLSERLFHAIPVIKIEPYLIAERWLGTGLDGFMPVSKPPSSLILLVRKFRWLGGESSSFRTYGLLVIYLSSPSKIGIWAIFPSKT
jgi:hypothetical protein